MRGTTEEISFPKE
jgi:predicted DNA-binding WGR domain protein